MKFKLSTVGSIYELKDKKDTVERLKKFGFEFEERVYYNKSYLQKATDYIEIDISTLEELIALSVKSNHDLIVRDGEIEIYDDYNE